MTFIPYFICFVCFFVISCQKTKYEIKREITSFKPPEAHKIDLKNPLIFQEVTVKESDYYTLDINILTDHGSLEADEESP